jgi:hypothetical protein
MEDIRGQKRKNLERLIVIAAVALGVTSIGLLVGEMGKSAELAYRLRDLEAERNEMVRDADRLAAEIDRMRSLESVRARQVFLGMVQPTNISFLQPTDNSLALR